MRRRSAVERVLSRCDLGDRIVDRHAVRMGRRAIAGRRRSSLTTRRRRSGQSTIGITLSLAERGGATLRRQLACGRFVARQPFQLLGKLVEAGVDLIQRAARACALALKFAGLFLAAFLVVIVARLRPFPRLRRLQIVIAVPRLAIVAAAPCCALIAAMPCLPIVAAVARFALIAPGPRAARPLVVVVVIIGE